MKVYYRISDKGNPKEKIPQADKISCLKNACNEFGSGNIYVIADNCLPITIEAIRKMGLDYEETTLGNSESFRYMATKVICDNKGDDSVYLLEDDYFHLPGSRMILEEGLLIADYVTLYDHPDKYVLAKDNGNPMNFADLKKTRIQITKSSHWMDVTSTTMTFACKVRTLMEDLPVWLRYTVTRNPKDFRAFVELTQNRICEAFLFLLRNKKRLAFVIMKNFLTKKKMRRVVSAIPAQATHAERKYLAPIVNWDRL